MVQAEALFELTEGFTASYRLAPSRARRSLQIEGRPAAAPPLFEEETAALIRVGGTSSAPSWPRVSESSLPRVLMM